MLCLAGCRSALYESFFDDFGLAKMSFGPSELSEVLVGSAKVCNYLNFELPYARHYKPRLIFFFAQFSLQLRLILQTIYVLKAEILHFLSLKSAAYKRERLQIESGL